MSIEKDLSNWDGKSSSDIEAIYNRYCEDKTQVVSFQKLIQKVDLQKGVSWLLKRYLENNHRLEKDEIAGVFTLLSEIEHWEAKLHILQCIPYLPIGKAEKKYVEAFLRRCLIDKNKFVRAWTYNGFYEISLQYPEYKEETKQFFEIAMRDEAPSVKARIRNIVKNDF